MDSNTKDKINKIIKDIDIVKNTLLVDSIGLKIEENIKHYKKWAKTVGQFSFQWHLK